MRRFFVVLRSFAVLVPLGTSIMQAQSAVPQTARQALIEMFFGEAPGHLEKHLPDVTLKAFESLDATNGYIHTFSALAAGTKSRGEKFETYDTGSTLLLMTGSVGSGYEKVELSVESDSLSGDEDRIDLGVHISREGKEEMLPLIPRLTFTMKMEAGLWRLGETGISLRIPLEDPAFLSGLIKRQRSQNEQMTIYAMRSVVNAEAAYQRTNDNYACALSALGSAGKQTAGQRSYLYDSQLVSGKKNGYVFVISGCDGSHYQLVAEPTAGAGQRAFCADENGSLRSSSDGKGVTCLTGGDVVEQPKFMPLAPVGATEGSSAVQSSDPSRSGQRVRISAGVAAGLIVSKVSPQYPEEARVARIQGTVVMRALISPAGMVESVSLISGHPLLAPAAMDAVKQWKYKPYLLNGKPVQVDTQVQVNFTLRSDSPNPDPKL